MASCNPFYCHSKSDISCRFFKPRWGSKDYILADCFYSTFFFYSVTPRRLTDPQIRCLKNWRRGSEIMLSLIFKFFWEWCSFSFHNDFQQCKCCITHFHLNLCFTWHFSPDEISMIKDCTKYNISFFLCFPFPIWFFQRNDLVSLWIIYQMKY